MAFLEFPFDSFLEFQFHLLILPIFFSCCLLFPIITFSILIMVIFKFPDNSNKVLVILKYLPYLSLVLMFALSLQTMFFYFLLCLAIIYRKLDMIYGVKGIEIGRLLS